MTQSGGANCGAYEIGVSRFCLDFLRFLPGRFCFFVSRNYDSAHNSAPHPEKKRRKKTRKKRAILATKRYLRTQSVSGINSTLLLEVLFAIEVEHDRGAGFVG
jgi:hypothetical protein